MIVSFAIYGLHLSWRDIGPPLARMFLDYEPGIHYSQLQMQAGIMGINTIRVYNPTKQIIDQDPACKFIKKWIPALKDYTTTEIKSYEKVSFKNYPKPIINFASQSKAMKDVVYQIRKSPTGKKASQKILLDHGSRRRRKSKPKPNNHPQLNLDL